MSMSEVKTKIKIVEVVFILPNKRCLSTIFSYQTLCEKIHDYDIILKNHMRPDSAFTEVNAS